MRKLALSIAMMSLCSRVDGRYTRASSSIMMIAVIHLVRTACSNCFVFLYACSVSGNTIDSGVEVPA
jgi:hypothetical protein